MNSRTRPSPALVRAYFNRRGRLRRGGYARYLFRRNRGLRRFAGALLALALALCVLAVFA